MADAPVPSLPTDAVSEILSRAPVKSLCRFLCVSKEWQALISDPSFVVQHKSRAVPEPLLVTSYRGKNAYTDGGVLVMDIEGTVLREIKVLGVGDPTLASSLDHLVCVICSGQVARVVDVATGTVLVAFLKRSCKKPNGNLRDYIIRLGRAALSGLYKAVRIVDFRRVYGVQPPQICEVLTIGRYDANWRKVQPPPAPVRMLNFSAEWAGATVDGVVHFLPTCSLLPRDSVLCFDVESEEWRKTLKGPLKDDIESWSMHRPLRIGELNKSLCMIHIGEHNTDQPPACIGCNIWLLTDRDNSTWVKAYSIPTNYCRYDGIQPLRVTPDGAKLLFYYPALSSLDPHVLNVYDSCDGTCTTEMMKIPNNSFSKIGICSLHLERFVVPPKQNVWHP